MTPKNLGPLAAAALCLLLPFSLCAQSMSMPGMGDAQTSSAPVATAPMSVEKLGDVNFAVSCKPSTQAQFNRGIALLHSFGYTQAERQFKSIVAADPTCAMAHWGVAMSQYHEIWGHPEESALEVGVAQMQQASALAVNPKLKITSR
jgi:hypothetical protein